VQLVLVGVQLVLVSVILRYVLHTTVCCAVLHGATGWYWVLLGASVIWHCVFFSDT